MGAFQIGLARAGVALFGEVSDLSSLGGAPVRAGKVRN